MQKKWHISIIKYLNAGLSVFTAAGILMIGCEKTNGPEPDYLCSHLYNSLAIMVNTDQGQVPAGAAIPLDSLKKLIITDTSIQTIVNMPESTSIAMATMGKIVFK